MITAEGFLKFLQSSELLKSTTRHSWTSQNRQESTAEHTWHMSLMAMTLAPHLKHKVDLLHCLKMITVHDLGEALTGDVPAFAKQHANKYEAEEKAIKDIGNGLPHLQQDEIHALWKEYSEKKTTEARFVKALDVLDARFEHLVSDLSTWAKEEFEYALGRPFIEYFEGEPLLVELYDIINERYSEKIRKEFPDMVE